MSLESVSRLADLTGRAKETVSKAVKAAGLTPIVRGKAHLYESREVIPLLFDALDAEQLDLTKERARLAHHQANRTQLEEDALRGRLVPIEDVERNWSEMIAAARAKLLALPQRIAQIAIAGTTIRDIEQSCRDEIYGALSELGGGSQPGGEGVAAAAAADGGRVGGSKKASQSRGKRGAGKVAKRKGAASGRANGGAQPV